jgi:hypothetical protein
METSEKGYGLHDKVQTAMMAWMEQDKENNTGAELSRRSGANQSDISRIKKGYDYRQVGAKASPIPVETYTRLATALALDLESGAVHWEEATVYQEIQEMCHIARKHLRFTLIDGMSGLGKSYALSMMAKRSAKTVYIQATKHMTAVDLLSEILIRFGKKNLIPQKGASTRRIHLMHREIAAFVAENEGWLVILDEMEDKRRDLYQAIKDLCDDFGRERQHRKASLLVCGIGLFDLWHRKHLSGQMPYTQLYTRFTEHYKPLSAGTPDQRAEFMRGEVKKLVTREGYTHPTAINWFCQKLDNMGALSSVVTDMNRATQRTATPRDQVTAAILDKFAQA